MTALNAEAVAGLLAAATARHVLGNAPQDKIDARRSLEALAPQIAAEWLALTADQAALVAANQALVVENARLCRALADPAAFEAHIGAIIARLTGEPK